MVQKNNSLSIIQKLPGRLGQREHAGLLPCKEPPPEARSPGGRGKVNSFLHFSFKVPENVRNVSVSASTSESKTDFDAGLRVCLVCKSPSSPPSAPKHQRLQEKDNPTTGLKPVSRSISIWIKYATSRVKSSKFESLSQCFH